MNSLADTEIDPLFLDDHLFDVKFSPTANVFATA